MFRRKNYAINYETPTTKIDITNTHKHSKENTQNVLYQFKNEKKNRTADINTEKCICVKDTERNELK